MGKGTIVEDKGEGLYTIDIILDTTRLDAQIAQIEDDIPKLLTKVGEAIVATADALAALQAAEAALNVAIAAGEGQQAANEAVIAARAAWLAARAAEVQARTAWLSATRAKDTLEGYKPVVPRVDAWCADYTEGLTGDVATVEVPAERNGVPVQIRPGFDDAAAYTPARDGQLQPAASGTPASVYYNLAMLPGVQKWRPQYRLATITDIAADGTCTIAFDEALSSAQDLDVNQTSFFAGVPIVYMDCDAEAFAVGDRVLAESPTRDWADWQVIGFESAPRSCYPRGIISVPASNDAPQGWGSPFVDEDDELIDPPRGTVGGAGPEWTSLYRDTAWSARHRAMLYGNIDWRGADGEVLSWWGVPTRYMPITGADGYKADIPSASRPYEPVGWAVTAGGGANRNVLGRMQVYRQGRVFADFTAWADAQGGEVFTHVAGAALLNDGGQRYLMAVLGRRSATSVQLYDEYLVRVPAGSSAADTDATVVIDSIIYPRQTAAFISSAAWLQQHPWMFSADGRSAVCVRYEMFPFTDVWTAFSTEEVGEFSAPFPAEYRLTFSGGFARQRDGWEITRDMYPDASDYSIDPGQLGGGDPVTNSEASSYGHTIIDADFRFLVAADYVGGTPVYAWLRQRTRFEFLESAIDMEGDPVTEWYDSNGSGVGALAEALYGGTGREMIDTEWLTDVEIEGGQTLIVALVRCFTRTDRMRTIGDSGSGGVYLYRADTPLDDKNNAIPLSGGADPPSVFAGPVDRRLLWMDLRHAAVAMRSTRFGSYNIESTGASLSISYSVAERFVVNVDGAETDLGGVTYSADEIIYRWMAAPLDDPPTMLLYDRNETAPDFSPDLWATYGATSYRWGDVYSGNANTIAVQVSWAQFGFDAGYDYYCPAGQWASDGDDVWVSMLIASRTSPSTTWAYLNAALGTHPLDAAAMAALLYPTGDDVRYMPLGQS